MGTIIKGNDLAASSSFNLPIGDDRYFHRTGPLSRQPTKKRSTHNQAIEENELVNSYFNDLVTFLKRKKISSDLLDDVAQETWLVVLQKFRRNEIRDVRKIRSFIFSVASNQLIMAYRKNQKTRCDELSEEPADYCNHQPDKILESKQLGRKIMNVVRKMGRHRDREMLTTFHLTNCTKAEFSEKHGVSLAHFDRVKYRSKMRFINAWTNAGTE